MPGIRTHLRCIPFDVDVEPRFDHQSIHVVWHIRAPGLQVGKLAVDPGALLESWLYDGTHWIFTCACGSTDCARVDAGVVVRRDADRITWTLPQPYFPRGWRERRASMPLRTFNFDARCYHRAIVRALEHSERYDPRRATLGPPGFDWTAWARRRIEAASPSRRTIRKSTTGATMKPKTRLTERFAVAVAYAVAAHGDQTRKGTSITYASHLLGVASLVLEFGGSEDQAIAGLLHDAIEDQGTQHEPAIRALFGAAVADIVRGCSDGEHEAKAALDTAEAKRADWQRRKEDYLAHLAHADEATLLVSCCDKLHNARAIVADLRGTTGTQVFDRFKAGRDGTLWYYDELATIFEKRGTAPARELRETVGQMQAAA